MDQRCELVYGYQHCVGRTQYHFGYAADEAAAGRWARRKNRENGGRVRVPDARAGCRSGTLVSGRALPHETPATLVRLSFGRRPVNHLLCRRSLNKLAP